MDYESFFNELEVLDPSLCIYGKRTNQTKLDDLFEKPIFKKLFENVDLESENNLTYKIQSFLQTNLKLHDTSEKQVEIIHAGISLLLLFIQKNWTGPEVVLDAEIVSKFSRQKILEELVLDGENIISVVQMPELLYFAEAILESANTVCTKLKVIKLWCLRCLFIHQQILEELSSKLFEKIIGLIDEIKRDLDTMDKSYSICLYLEFARIYMYYNNQQKSKLEINKATELSGIEISLSGALGKRTKFQSHDLAQLIVKFDIDTEYFPENSDAETCKSPQDIKLEDDVRLDKIKFADNSANKVPNLSDLHQAVILGNLFQTKKSQPKNSLADEELHSWIQCILDQPKIWSIKATTLLLRSTLEANHKRTVERSMMQVQVLADNIKEIDIPFEKRLKYFFVSHLPPIWEIQSILGSVLTSLGSFKSALEIYLNLEDWENVIHCYNTLQMRHKAKEIIEQELMKNPTSKLWCLLGDAADDVACYETAWELSNRKSARAQRHWGLFFYLRNNYAESIEHFQKSLEINSLQKELWYKLGYAGLAEEKWELSAAAYRRYVLLDSECFEAWNNLARCYCELNQKSRAWRALREALKLDYTNWKVWDNYMIVSCDLRMFDEVIKSYHEILNLKEKHVDIPLLNNVVLSFKSIKETDENQEDVTTFRSKLLELFGRLTSQVINNSELWFLYSEMVEDRTPENLTKKHQLLIKAHRSAVNKVGWEKKLENCDKVIYVLSKLLEVGLLTKKADILMSCKLAATSALSKIREEYPDANVCENLKKNLQEIEKVLKD